jgi:hypothetical protein
MLKMPRLLASLPNWARAEGIRRLKEKEIAQITFAGRGCSDGRAGRRWLWWWW